MPVTLSSHDENETIIIYSFVGNWTIKEFIDVDDIIWKRFHATDERIDLIFDLTQSNGLPLGISDLFHRAGEIDESPSRGINVIVKMPRFVTFMLRAMFRLYPQTASIYHMADTLEQALCIIENARNS